MKNTSLILLGFAVLFAALAVIVQNGSSWKTAIPVLISLTALGVSFYNVWVTKLSPFELHIGIGGRVQLSRDANPTLEALIKLPVTVANSGATGGFIEDFAIEIRKSGSSGAPLIGSCKAEDVREGGVYMGGPSGAPPPQLMPFHGIYLSGNESKTKILCFIIYYDQTIKQAPFDYELAEYNITLLSRTGNESSWKKYGTVDFKLDALDLKALAKPNIPAAGGYVVVEERSVFTSQRAESLSKLIQQKIAH